MSDLPDRIVTALGSWSDRNACRRRMAPELSYGRQFGPPPPDARTGAVAMLLYPHDGQWHLPLTIRPPGISRHGGQISLPGGMTEPGEPSEATARRELNEELGVQEGIRWLGRFSEFFVYVSNIRVAPWIAAVDRRPVWVPDPGEVTAVIELPVTVLLDADAAERFLVNYGPLTLKAPCYRSGHHLIWGATAMMLAELAGLLRTVAETGCVGRNT